MRRILCVIIYALIFIQPLLSDESSEAVRFSGKD